MHDSDVGDLVVHDSDVSDNINISYLRVAHQIYLQYRLTSPVKLLYNLVSLSFFINLSYIVSNVNLRTTLL